MIDAILAFMTGGGSSLISGLGGIIVGTIGAIFRQRHDREMRKLDITSEKAKYADADLDRDFQIKYLSKEAESAEKLALIQFDTKKMLGDFSNLLASIKSDTATYSKGWQDKVGPKTANFIGFCLAMVDVVRGLTRPGITAVFTYLVCDLWWQTRVQIVARIESDSEFASMVALIILDMIVMLAGTSIGWWFGSRPTKAPQLAELSKMGMQK